MIQINEELLDIEGIKTSNKSLLDLFIRRTAVITCTQEHVVEKIVKDQWKKANAATQPQSLVSEIDFCNMGTFFISPHKAKRRIARITKMQAGLQAQEESKKRDTQMQRNIDTINQIKFKTKQLV